MRIRLATLDDLPVLPVLESSAAQTFAGSAQAQVVTDPVTDPEAYAPFIAAGLVWIAELDGETAGFAACEAFPDALHLWELSIRQDRQRQGLGRALIDQAVATARSLGLPAVTLTTFRAIPWNAPIYARMGFVEIKPGTAQPRMADITVLEASLGLDVAARCFMRLAL